MSGGHYDYAYHHVEYFAEKLVLADPPPDPGWSRAELGMPEPDPADSYVDYELRKRFQEHLLNVAAAMKAIEWNDSGDGAKHEKQLIRLCLGLEDKP